MDWWPRCPNTDWRLLTVVVLALAGCGDGLELAPVEGLVTLDGAPLADAAVLLQPADGGPVAHGVTDAQGRFQVRTANRPGAVAGLHRIAVTKQEFLGVENDAPTADGISVRWLSPERYSQPGSSGLSAEVGSKVNHIELALTTP